MFDLNWSKIRLLACGGLISTLGYRILRSGEAKKLYTFAAAAVLREKEYIMTGVTDIREDCEDILADAKAYNEEYEEERSRIIEDHAQRIADKKEVMDAPERDKQ